MLSIKNLSVSIDEKLILKEFNLEVGAGQVHAIMGPNGAGKSTLAKVLAGDPSYEVLSGAISFRGEDLFSLEVEERSHKGLFVGFQYPIEIAGLTNFDFLFTAYIAKCDVEKIKPLDEAAFTQLLHVKLDAMQMKKEFLTRDLNGGFSGGEKKKNEILQMSILDPMLAILDETDSGLDIDALRTVAKGIEASRDKDKAIVLITHYQRLLEYVKPDVVHVMIDGKIVRSGDYELAKQVESEGYDFLSTHAEATLS